MRKTEASDRIGPNSPGAPVRAMRFAAVVLGIGLVMTVGAARAQDADDDDKTFEEKIIEGIMAGIGGTNMDNRGIEYRERSPLVVPPKLDLPPPQANTAAAKPPPNWPKDPDEARRKADIARRKKENKDPLEQSRILTPSELNAGRTAPQTSTAGEVNQPGEGGPGRDAILDRRHLGVGGGNLSS